MMRAFGESEVSMYHKTETNDDSPNRKTERVMRRARGKDHKENPGDSHEHAQAPSGMHRRRSALSIEDIDQQISSYFEAD